MALSLQMADIRHPELVSGSMSAAQMDAETSSA
jgi:hypothetical protein